MGYDVLAFVRVTVLQGSLDATVERLAAVPEIIEANSLSGEADLLCRVIATGHRHFEEVLQEILKTEGVQRTRSEIVLSRRIAPRIVPLLEKVRSGL